MPIPYSNDLRNKAIDMIDQGLEQKEVAKLLSINRTTLHRWQKRKKLEGNCNFKGYNDNQDKIKIKDTSKISDLLKDDPFITASEIASKLREDITSASISNYIKRLGLTLKKTPKLIKKETKSTEKNIKY